jgi:hypothetical protein
MADTRVSSQKVTKAGMSAVYTAGIIAGTTDFVFKNSGRSVLHAKKSGAGACTLTLKTPTQIQGLDITDPTVNVPASTGDVMIGPFPPSIFNDGANDMRFNLSEVTGLTFAIYEM